MSGYINDSEDFDNEVNSGGGGLRKQLEEVLAANKKLTDRLEQAEREKAATDLLKESGIDPALVAIIPAGEDPKAWVEKHGSLLSNLGTKPATAEDVEYAAAIAAADEDPALQAEREAQAQMQAAQEAGTPVYSQETLDALDKINDEESLLKFFKDNGAPA